MNSMSKSSPVDSFEQYIKKFLSNPWEIIWKIMDFEWVELHFYIISSLLLVKTFLDLSTLFNVNRGFEQNQLWKSISISNPFYYPVYLDENEKCKNYQLGYCLYLNRLFILVPKHEFSISFHFNWVCTYFFWSDFELNSIEHFEQTGLQQSSQISFEGPSMPKAWPHSLQWII